MYNKNNCKSTVCFILHAVPYQESSLLVDALTAEYGRVSFVARGARSARSSLKGLLQIFTPLKITLSGMDRSLKTLVKCESGGNSFNFIPPVMFSALYVNELISILYKIEASSEILFATYLDTLQRLQNGVSESWTLRQFELSLLSELGYGIDLDADSNSGEQIRPHVWYFYQDGVGFTQIMSDMIGGVNMNDAYNGSDIIALRTGENLTVQAMSSMKKLLRTIIDHLLEGKTLYSRELYRDYLELDRDPKITNDELED